jgi:hypothetical protein
VYQTKAKQKATRNRTEKSEFDKLISFIQKRVSQLKSREAAGLEDGLHESIGT